MLLLLLRAHSLRWVGCTQRDEDEGREGERWCSSSCCIRWVLKWLSGSGCRSCVPIRLAQREGEGEREERERGGEERGAVVEAQCAGGSVDQRCGKRKQEGEREREWRGIERATEGHGRWRGGGTVRSSGGLGGGGGGLGSAGGLGVGWPRGAVQ